MISRRQAEWAGRKRRLRLADGRDLAFIDTQGAGPPLLLLHGYTDSSRSWSRLEPMLSDHRLVMPDLPGHGGSTAVDAPSLEGFVGDLIQLLQFLRLGPVTVVGHSMGAMTALALAARHEDRVEAVISICGSLRPRLADQPALAAAIAALADPIDPACAFLREWHRCARAIPVDFARQMAEEAAAIPASIWRSLFGMLGGIDLRALARDIERPVLLIAGEEDALFGSSHRDALQAAFPAASACVLADLGHNPHWEAPRDVAEALRRFVSG